MTERIATVAVRDEDLVERAAAGDVDAFEALVAARLNRAFRTASAILGSEADAYDVVQEAFVAAWRHLPKLRDRTRFDAWLNKMIVNRCRDVSPHRQREGANGLGQMGEYELERAPGVSEAVQQQHRKTGRISQLGVGKPYLVREFNGLGHRSHVAHHRSLKRVRKG